MCSRVLFLVLGVEMKEEWSQMIEDCMERESRLSTWEAEFIDSVANQLARKGSLSEKQDVILNKIWEKATEKG